MGLIRSSSADDPHSTGGRISNEIIGVDTLVETGGTPNVVPIVSDDSEDYVLVCGVEDEDEEVSITSSESESDDEDESDDEYDEEEESEDDIEEKMIILADAFNLKLLAQNYLHPEDKIASNGISGRCYFDRASAHEVVSKEEADEYAKILSDAKALKKVAEGYLNPELAICEADPVVFGRNYFAPDDEGEERAKILMEATMLKRHASNYLHPETKVTNADATAFGRNYFDRFSSAEVLSKEEADERAEILADAVALKKQAKDYSCPEAPIHVDPTAYGRNFFTADSEVDEEERAQVLYEASILKQLATNYQHPEVKVETSDASLFGRNYFSRSDAAEFISKEEAEERAEILADADALKKQAMNYSCPEAPINVDATTYGRNFFTIDSDSEVDEEERAQILAEASLLKQVATNYQHPEVKVETSDASLFGRNYFSRSSATEPISLDEANEREEILADAVALEKEAKYYSCPEDPINVDSTAYGRNFFTVELDSEDEEERAHVLAEASMLKQNATDYHHPEVKIDTSDASLFGRNYFYRYSAPESISKEEAEERADILADTAALKKEVKYYSCPEAPVDVDPTAYGRSFFAAEPDSDVDEEERVQILAEAFMLKQTATNYQHPEVKVETSDASLFGRNYFCSYGATESTSKEEAGERMDILADCAILKRNAIAYSHPENEIEVDSSMFARNYFTSAADFYVGDEEAKERVQILFEGNVLKKAAVDYGHPERKVQSDDPTLFARNFFHTAKVSSEDANLVSSLNNEAVETEDHHDFEFDDGFDHFTDMRKQLKFVNQSQKPLKRAASFANFAHNTIEVKEDDGQMSRSPSCVAFFDFF